MNNYWHYSMYTCNLTTWVYAVMTHVLHIGSYMENVWHAGISYIWIGLEKVQGSMCLLSFLSEKLTTGLLNAFKSKYQMCLALPLILLLKPTCIKVPVICSFALASIVNGFIYAWGSSAKRYKSHKKYKLNHGNNKLQIHGISNVPLMGKKYV